MSSEDTFSALIGRIYDAALCPDLWPDVLEEIAGFFNATACHLFIVDFGSDRVHLASLNRRFSLERAKEYHEHYARLDERLSRSFDFPLGRVLLDWQLVDSDAFEASEFYNDFYLPHGLRWCVMGMPARDGPSTIGIAVARAPAGGAFSKQDAERLQALFPHLSRVLKIMRRTRALESLADAMGQSLDRVATGVLIVDAEGRPCHLNVEARRILAARDCLGLPNGRIAAALPAETRALRRAVARTLDRDAKPTERGAALALSRPSGAWPLQVVVAPLNRHAVTFPLGKGDDHALVLVSDPERMPLLPEDKLARLFGLTPAEARLAARLAEGQTLKRIAEEAGRSENTLRWTLKNLLAKTDCHRQVDLVRVLRTGPLALTAPHRTPEQD